MQAKALRFSCSLGSTLSSDLAANIALLAGSPT
uniref:Uncharacterized protein n=1 Tax=Nymphaea colorata TaxID=210225 RepID=A0A5K0XWM9_9MAGN